MPSPPPPAVAACLFMKQSCCLVLFCCAMRLCCKNLAGFYPSAAWSTDSSDVAWKAGSTDEGSGRAGVWPAARCESAGSMGDLCYWMGLTLNSAPCSVADNGLITNVPALQFAQRRQPGQSEKKPWWAARGGRRGGVNKKERQKEKRDMESRVKEKEMTPRGRATDTQDNKKEEREREKNKM